MANLGPHRSIPVYSRKMNLDYHSLAILNELLALLIRIKATKLPTRGTRTMASQSEDRTPVTGSHPTQASRATIHSHEMQRNKYIARCDQPEPMTACLQ